MAIDLDRTRRLFRHFAQHECADEPLYRALCEIVAGRPDLLALLDGAPAEQQRPNLWLAAVHDLLLAGTRHPLAAYYPSVGGEREADAALAACVDDFVQQHREALHRSMSTRSTQTNEIGRCAVLWPALQALVRRTGRSTLALLDLGCSAGLNLGVDHYRLDLRPDAPVDGAGTLVDEAERACNEAPVLPCRLVGPHRPQIAPLAISHRLGIDPAPIDVHDEAAVRWLRACLWPSNLPRLQRFDQAVALAQREHWPVRQVADCTAAIEPWLDGLPRDVQPVVVNTWVLCYFERSALQRHLDTVSRLVRERGLAWISAEGPELPIGDVVPPPPAEPGPEADRATLWALCWRDGARERCELLARSHPHGRWMEWLDAPTQAR